MNVDTLSLSGKALDWAVAKCRGATDEWRQYGPFFWHDTTCIRVDGHDIEYSPSDMWMLAGLLRNKGFSVEATLFILLGK